MTRRADEEVLRRAEQLAEIEGGTVLDAVPAILRADPELAAAYEAQGAAPTGSTEAGRAGPEPGCGRKLSADEARQYRGPKVGYFTPGYGIYEWTGG